MQSLANTNRTTGWLNSRNLVWISISCSILCLIACISGNPDPRADLDNFSHNAALLFIGGMVALGEAAKKRNQEKEANVKSKPNHVPYAYAPSYTDFYIAFTVSLCSAAIFAIKIGLPFLSLLLFFAAIMIIFGGLTFTYGNSMLPTIANGDWLIVERRLIIQRALKRGDIVCFSLRQV